MAYELVDPGEDKPSESVMKEFYGCLLPQKAKPADTSSRDFLYQALRKIMKTFKAMFRNIDVEKDVLEG